jgi:hypothetical protein
MKIKKVLCLLICVSIFSISYAQEEEPIPSHLEELIKGSSFIFKGTIKKLNDATLPIITRRNNTIIVTVDDVLKVTNALKNLKGKDITVQLQEIKDEKIGQQLIFFTNGWLYGKSIAVKEVGTLPTKVEGKSIQEQVIKGIEITKDKDLQKRIWYAELVVVGTVMQIKELEQDQKPRLTEHNPRWQQAIIEIESVEKGEYPNKTVTILFPGSNDVMWDQSPKFKKGQKGIWIIHKDQLSKLGIKEVEGLTALDPMDFYSTKKIDRIRRVIKQIK